MNKQDPKTINEILDFTDEEVFALSDEKIKDLEYGILYFSFFGNYTPRRGEVLTKLQTRLKDIKSKEAENEEPIEEIVDLIVADCGHAVDRNLLMAASLGSSCPDCYDRMSN